MVCHHRPSSEQTRPESAADPVLHLRTLESRYLAPAWQFEMRSGAQNMRRQDRGSVRVFTGVSGDDKSRTARRNRSLAIGEEEVL